MYLDIKRLKTLFLVLTETRPLRTQQFRITDEYMVELKSNLLKLSSESFNDIEYWKGDGDERWFGIQKLDKYFFKTLFDYLLTITGCDDLNNHDFFVLYGKINESLEGSGGGWHRDAFPLNYKIIIYLTDVSSDSDGPFEFMPRTANKFVKLKDLLLCFFKKDWTRGLNNYSTSDRILFKGKAGSGILVNTSAIHRGHPVRNRREAITFYIYRKTPKTMQKYL